MSGARAAGVPRRAVLGGIALLLALVCACKPAEGPVTLRFWAMGREGEVVQELVSDFERENPGVHVIVQQIPWSAAHEKLLTAYVGRSTPDVGQLGNTWIAEFVALHAIDRLDAHIDSSREVSRAGFFPGIWETNVVDSATWGVPWYVDTRVLFYRRDMLARAGWSHMPGTWKEWRQAMVAMRDLPGASHYAILLPANEWPPAMILGLQAGSPMLTDDGTRGVFSGPEFRRAFEFYIGLFRDHLAPPVTNNEVANLYQEFERGTFGMYITGPWNLGEFERRLGPQHQGDWTTAPLPGPTGPESGASMAGGSSLVLFRGSQHPREAWRLIEFLSRPEQQVRFYRLTGDLPARLESWADSSLASNSRAGAFRDQLQRVVAWPRVPEWEEICIKLQDHAERAIRGVSSPESALAALDRDVDRALEKRRWMLEHRRGMASVVP